LVSKLQKQSEVRAKEDKLETKNLGIGSGFSNIIGAVTAPARSIFDKILEFFGLIALGVLVQKLPAIIAKIEEFFNSGFIKTLGDIFNVIGFGFQKLGNLINILTPQKQKELDNELKLIGNEIDDGFKLTDQSNQDLNEFERRLREKEKELQSSQSQSTPSSSPPSVPMAPMIPGSMYPFTIPQSSPNPQKPQKFSRGGTVKPSSNKDQVNLSTSPPTPRQSGGAKAAQRSSETGFLGFYNASNDLGEVARSQQESVNNFEMMVYNFKRWSSLSGKEGAPPGTTPPGTTPPGTTPPGAPASPSSQYRGQTFASGARIGPTGDTDYQQTGLNMNLDGGIGTPIYAPFDLIYRGKGTDGMPSVGLDGTPDVRGPAGKGFGYYGAYYFKRLNTSNNSGNQSLFIYAVQPVETFVPFPYAVPIEDHQVLHHKNQNYQKYGDHKINVKSSTGIRIRNTSDSKKWCGS
jgi:hypothetical protein